MNPTGAGQAEPADAALRETLAALARGASLETPASRLAEIDGYAALIPPGTRVFVAWVPGTPPDRIVEAAVRLRRIGMEPVPHVAAREIGGEAEARRLAARLRAEAGVTSALAIAGDAPRPRGPYGDSLALLRSGLFEANGITRIGVAGYPEGHGTIGEADLLAALRGKTGYARDHGIELFVVSQFCFEGALILEWLRALRARGVGLPVWIGLAGPARLGTLIKYGMRCGIGNSLRFLSARASQAGQLLAQQGPEQVTLRIAQAEAGLGIAGLHFFSFGGFPRTARWMRSVAEGRFRLGEEDGFRLLDP